MPLHLPPAHLQGLRATIEGPFRGASKVGLPELEARLAERTGARHCIATRSGADALLLALSSLGLEPGDEVITSPFASGEAVHAMLQIGARPVFVDIDRATCNIDSSLVEASISPRTRAIVPVSLYGQPADMEEINAIAKRNGLLVLEDALESFGASYRRRQSGNLSTIACVSLRPEPSLGWHGRMGAVFATDDTLAETVRARRDAESRPNERQLDAAFARLDGFGHALQRRARVAASYDALFTGRLQRVGRERDRSSAFSFYTLVLEQRTQVRAKLDALGIATTIHPLPLHLHPAYAFLDAAQRCPVATMLSEKVLNLPIDANMDEQQATRIALAVLRAARVEAAVS